MSTKRLSVDLPEDSHALLGALAKDSGRSMSEVVRVGIGLFRIHYAASRKGRRVVVVGEPPEPESEIVGIL